MPYYFQQPFAVAGDRVTIPVANQPDGSISFNEGYGGDYSLPRASNPAALTIEREKYNQLMYYITSNIQYLQQFGAPEFISSSDNGGTAYGYARSAVVRYNNGSTIERYVSLIDSNTTLPTNTSNWAILRNDPAYLGLANTFAAIQTFSASATPVVINSTDSTGAKITLRDNGTTRGAIGASSTYALIAYLADLTTIAGGWNASGHLIPGAAATYDLGTSSVQYRAVYANRYEVLGSTVPTNGMYLSAANTIGIAASGTLVGRFTSTGINATAIGATTPSTGSFSTLAVNGNAVTLGGAFTTSGAFTTTLTVTAVTNVTLPTTGTLATIDGTETLTNKTINLANNTLSGTTVQFNAALSDNDFATIAGAETLTNKTITRPTLTLRQSASPTPTAEGDIQWDTDDDLIVIGNGTGQTIFARTQNGTYTPTLSNATNVAASTVYALSWFRVGNTVTVSGVIDIDVTTLSAQTDFDLSLPVASNFTLLQDAGGSAVCESANQGFSIQANAITKTFRFRGIPSASAANVRYGFIASYRVL